MSASLFSDKEGRKLDGGGAEGGSGAAGFGNFGTVNYGSTPRAPTIVDSRLVNGDGYIAVRGSSPGIMESDKDMLVVEVPDVPDKEMALYEEESHQRPFVSNIISRLANYDGGVVPQFEGDDEDGDPKEKKKKKKMPPRSTKLGMMMGVYFPCIQNIFGIILFIRFAWVVGTAGWLQALGIVILCCVCAIITSVSMSAIATNGIVAGGGSYFMISRALGPEFGGAVGVLFYLGTAVSSSLYIVGAVEIFLNYMVPAAVIPLPESGLTFNNYRIYGTVLFIIMFIWVLIGVRFVSKVSVLALFCVIVSIICIYIGIFVAHPGRGPHICYVGDRLISKVFLGNDLARCNKVENDTNSLYQTFCISNATAQTVSENPDCEYLKANEVRLRPGIPGLPSGVFYENTYSKYSDHGDRIGFREPGNATRGDIISDITSSFVVLIGIVFPAVTGFMSGSNRSGDLSDPQRSIPSGTIGAVLTTSVMYITCLLLIAGSVEGQLLRDKFGESMGGGLILAQLAWPNEWVVIIGAFLSTCGAALQSLVGAPRLLQAIAADGVIPFLNVFAVNNKNGEPIRALLLTGIIAEAGILIANIDNIAPIISEFFLMCYGFVNLACALQTILKTPNWRPRFRFYHWTVSLLGVSLCLVLMFLTGWYYAIVAILIAAGIYKYIEYKGAEKEWGDGLRGLAMSAARYALLRLEEGPPHVKNWRPQILILLKLKGDTLEPKYRKMLTFSSQLKEGKGLTLVGSVIEGDYAEKYASAQAVKQTISAVMKKERTQGFSEVIVAENMTQGLCYLIQGSGVGGLTHNTVMLGWPHGWRHCEDEKSYRVFLDTLRNINNGQLAALVAKGIDQFPENTDRLMGTIDIWWIVHDGGLLMLLPFLLTQHKVWKLCTMRIFTVAQLDDNIEQIKQDLQTFLYHLRLRAEVSVVPLPDNAIRAYTYERALIMEQRTAMMKDLRLKKRKFFKAMPQEIVDSNAAASASASPEIDATNNLSDGWSQVDISEEKDGDDFNEELLSIKPDKQNIRRMHTAVRLNEVIVEKSHDARLVILNLPGPPKSAAGDENYMEYLEVLTEGIERVLMVRGGGREVITIYS